MQPISIPSAGNGTKPHVSGSLEFEKPQMNIAVLKAKMKKFFDTVSADELIERFEKLGYKFETIDKSSQ